MENGQNFAPLVSDFREKSVAIFDKKINVADDQAIDEWQEEFVNISSTGDENFLVSGDCKNSSEIVNYFAIIIWSFKCSARQNNIYSVWQRFEFGRN